MKERIGPLANCTVFTTTTMVKNKIKVSMIRRG